MGVYWLIGRHSKVTYRFPESHLNLPSHGMKEVSRCGAVQDLPVGVVELLHHKVMCFDVLSK